MLISHGPSSAPIFLIGDGGTKVDIKSNYALSSQEFSLKRLCSPSIYGSCWNTVLVKEEVNLYGKHYYNDNKFLTLVSKYKDLLFEEINQIDPWVLVPLNEGVFHLLTGLNSIYKFRGSVLLTQESLPLKRQYKVLPVLGPKPFLDRNERLQFVTELDLSKLPKLCNDSPPLEQNLNIWIARSSSEFQQFLARMQGKGPLFYDIETLLGIPTCASFCFDGQESVCVPFIDKSIPLMDRAVMFWMMAKYLANPNIPKGNQNIKYDWRHSEKLNVTINNIKYDPVISASLLMPELDKDLGFLNSIYTDIPYFKAEGKEYDPNGIKNKTKFYLYNAKDSLAAWRINATQQDEIDQLGLRPLHDKLITLLPIYKKLEDNGLLYDDEARKVLLAKYYSLLNIQIIKLHTLTGEYNLNPGSPLQMSKVVFDMLGYKRLKGVKGTDEESLEHLMVFGEPTKSPVKGRQILQTILDCRKVHKVIEYLETYVHPDRRWRSSGNLAGTTTGRTSFGKTTDVWLEWVEKKKGRKIKQKYLGRSFQTIAKHGFMIDGVEYGKDLRTIFVPTPGYVFVENDLSQAEARVDAVLAGNYRILDVFDGPVGIHKLTGGWIFDCPPSDIKKNTIVTDPTTGISVDRYHAAKTARHAAERNMKPPRLVMMLQKPLDFCTRVLKDLHAKQPELQEVFHREVIQAINQTRTLVAPNGRRRQFLGRKDHHTYNEAISYLPQAIVSDQMKFSLIPTMEEEDRLDIRLINEAHDGVLAEVPKEHVEAYITLFKKNVETPINFKSCSLSRDFELTIPSEASVSETNWLDMRDYKVG